MSKTLVNALAEVHYGAISSIEFLSATQAGRPVDAPGPLAVRSATQERLDEAWAAHEGRFLWGGPIPDSEKPGIFFVLNPYQTRFIQSTFHRDLLNGAGLTADAVGEISGIFVEVDEAPDGGRLAIETQAQLYDQIEMATGLRFTTAVLSGDHRESALEHIKPWQTREVGKSLHVVIATRWQGAGPEARRLRQEATDALCAIAGADPLVRDLARKMRMGGVLARQDCTVRVQTCLRADPSAVFDLQDVRDRLVAYADRLGIDVPKRLMVMTTAFQCRQKAKAWIKAADQGLASRTEADEAAETLMDLALEIRRGGEVTASHRRLIGFVGTPKGQIGVTTQSGETRIISTGHADGWDHQTTILTHTSGREGTASSLWSSMCRGYRVPDIHCIGHADAHASAYLTEWKGSYTIHCPSCGKIRSGSPQTQGDRPSGLIDLIEADDGGAVIVEEVSPRPHQSVIRGMTPDEIEALEARRAAADAAHEVSPQAQALSSMIRGIKRSTDFAIHLQEASRHTLDLSADLLGEEGTYSGNLPNSDNEKESTSLLGKFFATQQEVQSLQELAWERYYEEGAPCPQGLLGAKARPGSAAYWKLACRRRTCRVCGPRYRRAERAAAHAALKALGDWMIAEVRDDVSAKWWATQAPDHRAHLKITLDQKQTITLLLWRSEGAPSPTILKKISTPSSASTWATKIEDMIQEDSTPAKNLASFAGTASLTKSIVDLRDWLLGRKKNSDRTEKIFVTKASETETQAQVERNLPSHLQVDVTTSWSTSTRDYSKKRGSVQKIIDVRTGLPADMAEIQDVLENAHIFRGQKTPEAEEMDAEFDFGRDGFTDLSLKTIAPPAPPVATPGQKNAAKALNKLLKVEVDPYFRDLIQRAQADLNAGIPLDDRTRDLIDMRRRDWKISYAPISDWTTPFTPAELKPTAKKLKKTA